MSETQLPMPTGAIPAEGGVRGWVASPGKGVALGYLAAIAVAELVTTFVEPRLGLVLHAIILAALLLHSAMKVDAPGHELFLTLTFAPLIRVLSLSLPLASLPRVYWYAATSLPLFLATLVVARTLGYSMSQVGIGLGRPRAFLAQFGVALVGPILGSAEYLILRPEPLIGRLSAGQIWVPALVLLVCTGFFEELVFRGFIQRAAIGLFGGARGLVYTTVLFAVLHTGYRSVLDVAFVFVVGLFFGYVVRRTGSLVGVSAAHGLTNICLYLVVPFL